MPRPALALALALIAAGCGGEGERSGQDQPGSAQVVRVIDGDTIVVRIGGLEESVRLLGVDTPESVDPRSPVECFGEEASRHTGTLLPPGTDVHLVRDIEARDHYSRLLAYVYRAEDGTFVNLQLVRDGFADELSIPPNVAHAGDFTTAATRAQADGLGLWSAC